MKELYRFDLMSLLKIVLILFRLLGLMLFFPGIMLPAVPQSIKVLFCLTIAVAVSPLLRNLIVVDTDLLSFAGAAVRETLLGCFMGFIVYVTLEAFQIAGNLLSTQIGLSMISLFDHNTQSQNAVLGPFFFWAGIILFFILDLHHSLLIYFFKSYELSGSLDKLFEKNYFSYLITLTAYLFELSVQIALPIGFLIFICHVGFGVLARLSPQINMLLFSFPITALLGIFALFLFTSELMETLSKRFDLSFSQLEQFLGILKG